MSNREELIDLKVETVKAIQEMEELLDTLDKLERTNEYLKREIRKERRRLREQG